MTDISALEARLKAVEDRLEITQLLMMHPLAIDGGEGDFWMSHWTEDSLFDRLADPERHSGSYQGVYGKPTMLEEINSPELAALRKAGLVHLSSNPSILIDGDVASATSYTQLVALEGQGYRTRRVVINRWELARVGGRWKITRRTIRPLGHPESLDLMRAGLPLG